MGDFADLDRIPQFHASWSEVEAKIRTEGGPNLELNLKSAQDLFARTYNDLVSNDIHVDVGDALSHAKGFVVAGRTIEGAVRQVEGLINSSKAGAPPQAVVQQFTGVLVGLAVAAGLSAGVGALIVAGVGITIELLTKIGLFGNTSPGVSIPGCSSSVTWNPPPIWTVGCIGMYGARVPSPANVGWRPFPTEVVVSYIPGGPTITYAQGDNAYWFAPNGYTSGVKNIEMAFPAFDRLQCDLAVAWPPRVAEFYKAFYTAWKSNNEYALNGLKSQPDWVVLKQFLATWNVAHEPGTPFVFEARGDDLSAFTDAGCTSRIPYLAILVDRMTREDPRWAEYAPGKSISINTGPRKAVRGGGSSLVAGSGSSSTGMTVAKTAAVVVVAGLTGAAVYSFVTKKPFVGVLKSVGRKTVAFPKKAYRSTKKVFKR